INGSTAPKSRARTGYQRELEEHKQRRIDWLINKKRKEALKEQRLKREKAEPNWLIRDMYRISQLDTSYDSEEDETAIFGYLQIRDAQCPTRTHDGTGLGGILPVKRMGDASKDENARPESAMGQSIQDAGLNDDLGEEAEHWKKIINRTSRRLFR